MDSEQDTRHADVALGRARRPADRAGGLDPPQGRTPPLKAAQATLS